MATYLSQFCENLSTTLQLLWMLREDGALIASAPTLIYYSLDKPVTLQVDASEWGLGAALLQPNDKGELQPVAYSSSSLSDTER